MGGSENRGKAWREQQRIHHLHAEDGRFRWQTTDPFVSQREQELLRRIACLQPGLVLEVGCGEGANIVNLGNMGWQSRSVGVDVSYGKVRYSKELVGERCSVLAGDALHLPFHDTAFDLVFCRDLLHHVDDRIQAVEEMLRVCRGMGHLLIIEGNGRKWTNRLFARLIPAEAGMGESTLEGLGRALGSLKCGTGRLLELYTVEATNFFRVLLHYRFGFPSISRWNWARWLLGGYGCLLEKAIPVLPGAYIIALLRKE